jgi:hypothetical protein
MSRTVWLTGMLPFVLLASAAITAPLATFLLWLYRRAVLRSMARTAGAAAVAPLPPAEGTRPPLAVHRLDARVADGSSDAYRRGRSARRRGALAYGLAGLAYAVVFTAAWMLWVTPDGFIPGRILWLLSTYWWPTVIVLGLLVTTSGRGRLALAGGYALVLAPLAVYLLARNPTLTPTHLVTFWAVTNGPETVLLLAFLARRIRAVGPLVLAFVTAGVAGAVVLVQLTGSDDSVLWRLARLGSAVGLGARGIVAPLYVTGFALFAVLGWWTLRRLATRYRQKLLSDQTILAWAVILLFGVAQSIALVFTAWPLILTGLVAAAAWRVVARIGLARAAALTTDGPTLLLLRVFALGRRSQGLFDELATRWLRSGSIAMIAGPDLATTTIEPHEFLEFVSGKLSRQFVRGGPDLERRLAALDTAPDREGRFRTTEFFCHADTWQETMRRLARRCDVILMDLRGFSPGNAGCVYEIGELLGAVPLARVVFLIDGTTDEPFLQATLARLWQGVPPDSPNLADGAPAVRLFEVARAAPRELDGLLRLLLAEPASPAARLAADTARATA